jgi:hypothetical protein
LCGDAERPGQREDADGNSKCKTRHSLLLVERQLRKRAHCSPSPRRLLDAHRTVQYDQWLFRLQTTLQ